MAGIKPIEIDQPQEWIDEQNRKFAAAGNEKRYVRKGASPSPAPSPSPSPIATTAGEQKTAIKDTLGGATFKPSNNTTPILSEKEKESGMGIPGIAKEASGLSDPEAYAKTLGLGGRSYLEALSKLNDQQRKTFREKFGMAVGSKGKDEMLKNLLEGRY